VKQAFAKNNALMVRADHTDRDWIISEFLYEIKQPNLPVNLFIPGNPSKKTILMNGPITQNMYIDAINEVGDAGAAVN